MRVLPIWARKPAHKKEVIASSKGWVVKDTGELLSSYKGLDEKLKELFKEIEQLSFESTPEAVEQDEEPAPEQKQDEQEESEDKKTVEVAKPKGRGRPKKNATNR